MAGVGCSSEPWRDARTVDGRIVLLEDQDRNLWRRGEIAAATDLLDRTLRLEKPGQYQIQAAIGALHADAEDFDATDWDQILALYDRLLELRPSPVVALNRAVAIAMARGPEHGLRELETIADHLDGYPWVHSARGELLRRVDRHDEAIAAYGRAISLTDNTNARDFLEERLAALS